MLYLHLVKQHVPVLGDLDVPDAADQHLYGALWAQVGLEDVLGSTKLVLAATEQPTWMPLAPSMLTASACPARATSAFGFSIEMAAILTAGRGSGMGGGLDSTSSLRPGELVTYKPV